MKTRKIFSKRYGMRAYEAYMSYLLNNKIFFEEEEDALTITVITEEEES